jgi:hypothetical protein
VGFWVWVVTPPIVTPAFLELLIASAPTKFNALLSEFGKCATEQSYLAAKLNMILILTILPWVSCSNIM